MSKHSGKYVSYLRVSTDKQGERGLGIEGQREAVRNWLNGGRWTLVDEVVEVESGRKTDRKKLNEALRICRLHNATLVVAKLDRLSRDAGFLKTVVRESGERGVVFCDMPNLPEGPQGKFVIAMMAEVAELGAGMISARTRAAMAVLKARGVQLGTRQPERIKAYADQGRAAAHRVVKERAAKRAQDLAPFLEGLRAKGITSKRGMARALNEAGIETPRGGTWMAPQVARLLETLDKAQTWA